MGFNGVDYTKSFDCYIVLSSIHSSEIGSLYKPNGSCEPLLCMGQTSTKLYNEKQDTHTSSSEVSASAYTTCHWYPMATHHHYQMIDHHNQCNNSLTITSEPNSNKRCRQQNNQRGYSYMANVKYIQMTMCHFKDFLLFTV